MSRSSSSSSSSSSAALRTPQGKAAAPEAGLAGSSSRDSGSSSFEAFIVAWHAKHGAAARKERVLDALEPPPGPSWAAASPQPFRVLRLASAPPPPSAGK